MRPLTFHLIPHTHWDREWYLTRAGFQARLAPALDDLLDQLERDPAARFVLDGQTVLLEDYLAVRPEAGDRVARLARRGALEVGPWYVLADELIPSGESLIRNLLEGGRDARHFGGMGRMEALYSPDAFGHPGRLPLLAREFGMRRAVIRRGLGRPAGRDRDLYRWETGDGDGILVYHLPRAGYEVAMDLTRAGTDLARAWSRIRSELVARSATDQVAVFVGADHHPAPRDLAGLRARLQALEPRHTVRVSGLIEFFTAVERAAPTVPALRGELRRIEGHTWVLQGVHATRARLKRRHGDAELSLTRLAEPLAALAAWAGVGRDQRGLLRLAWRGLLQSQFHDTLAGSCSDEVAREQGVRLATVEALSREIAVGSLHALAGHDPDLAWESPSPARLRPRLILWNPVPRPRSAIVTAEITCFRRDVLVGPPAGRAPRAGRGYRPFTLQDGSGRIMPVQVLARRPGHERVDAARHHPDQDEVDRVWVAFGSPEVPGLGMRLLEPRSGRQRPAEPSLDVGEGALANRWVRVWVSRTGVLAVEDRHTGQRYEQLAVVQDEPDAGDTYTYSRGRGRTVRSGRPVSRAVAARGPLVGAVETRWTMVPAGGGRGTLGLRLLCVLHADSPVVRLRLDLENGASDHRVRLRFPVGAGEAALAGTAFGVERRGPVVPSTRRAIEREVATVPAQRFVAAGAGARGLALFAPGFFEYEWTPQRDLVVTLLRSVGELSRGDLPERPGHAGWPMPTPLAQELGLHTVNLALAPVSEDDLGRPDRLERVWEDVFLPTQGAFVRACTALDPAPLDQGVTLDGEGLVASAIKPAESGNGIVLRCYNGSGSPARGRWVLPRPAAGAIRLRADETELGPVRLRQDRRAVPLVAQPGELVTVLVRGA